MKITFRGTRGSIPVPGEGTVKYGGNTSCFQVESAAGDCLIFDAGSGLRPLGEELLSKMPVTCNIFLTHTHWDHIQGLPFFTPIYVPGNTMHIYGPHDSERDRSIANILSFQMDKNYFPVNMEELQADISFYSLHRGEDVQVGDVCVHSFPTNHPCESFGYLLSENGKRFFYSGDHEGFDEEISRKRGTYEADKAKWNALVEFLQDVDAAVVDAQYTAEEYKTKVGWGHSTADMWIEIAKKAGIKKLFLNHHEPLRSDEMLEGMYDELMQKYPDLPFEVELARENFSFEL
ncbi:MAG: MBL fold metallo-hydrolase [Desulfovibrio sp.]